MSHNKVMRAFVLVLLTITLMLQLGSISQVRAQEGQRIVGVSKGNYATYGNINVTWTSNDPAAKKDAELEAANQTEWFRHNVTDVTGSVISFQNTTQLKSGVQTKNYAWVDVTEGVGNASLEFISAYLVSNDSLYEGYPVYINETVLRTYVGVPRATNHLNVTINSQTETNPPQKITASFNYYWDYITGILTERRASFSNVTGNYMTNWSRSDVIIGTNMWGIDTVPPKADAGNDMTVLQNEVVDFDGSRSFDNFGIVIYAWDFGDNVTAVGEVVTRAYSKPGTYKVVLTVQDRAGLTDTDSINVVVVEVSHNNEDFPYWILAAALLVVGGLSFFFYHQRKAKSRIRRRRMMRNHA